MVLVDVRKSTLLVLGASTFGTSKLYNIILVSSAVLIRVKSSYGDEIRIRDTFYQNITELVTKEIGNNVQTVSYPRSYASGTC